MEAIFRRRCALLINESRYSRFKTYVFLSTECHQRLVEAAIDIRSFAASMILDVFDIDDVNVRASSAYVLGHAAYH